MHDVAAALAAGQRPAEVGHGDDRELEPLGRVHGHDPDPVVVLGLGRGDALALVALGELLRRGEEAAQVAALVLLELAREPHQLAHVRHPPAAPRARASRCRS